MNKLTIILILSFFSFVFIPSLAAASELGREDRFVISSLIMPHFSKSGINRISNLAIRGAIKSAVAAMAVAEVEANPYILPKGGALGVLEGPSVPGVSPVPDWMSLDDDNTARLIEALSRSFSAYLARQALAEEMDEYIESNDLLDPLVQQAMSFSSRCNGPVFSALKNDQSFLLPLIQESTTLLADACVKMTLNAELLGGKRLANESPAESEEAVDLVGKFIGNVAATTQNNIKDEDFYRKSLHELRKELLKIYHKETLFDFKENEKALNIVEYLRGTEG
jgi:hypothetical protein